MRRQSPYLGLNLFQSWVSNIGKTRSVYRGQLRKVMTPMLPIFRQSVTSYGFPMVLPSEQIAVVREMLTEINNILNLTVVTGQSLKTSRMMLPRLEVFRRQAAAIYANVENIDAAFENLKKLMADHAYKFRAAFEKAPAKYAVLKGGKRDYSVEETISKFIQPVSRAIGQPGSFSIVVDFSAAGGVKEFVAAFLAGFGKNKQARSQIAQLLGDIGAKYEITEKGIFQQTRAGVRSAPLKAYEDAASKIISAIVLPEIKRLWVAVVHDFFLREPTSVSRWFPARPMARKGIGDRRNSLLGMLLTGVPVMTRHGEGKGGGFAGAFVNFDTNRAPYWYVVQYGYHGRIRAKDGRGLTLKDPDPQWWSMVQWYFGARSSGFKFYREKRGGPPSGVFLNPGGRQTQQYISQAKVATIKMPLLLPSGRKFYMRTHPSLALHGGVEPVHYTRGRKTKHVTYSLTVRPGTIIRQEVRGQRASMFIERILAMFAERQHLLQPAFFRAASAFLLVGEKEWSYLMKYFQMSQWRLGG